MATQRDIQPKVLGELESAVMRALWERGEGTVQDVQRALQPERDSAYTTLMTVMSRLTGKGLLVRRKEGRAYVYAPAIERESVATSMLSSLVEKVFDGSSTRAIAHLLESDEEVDDAELDRLEELIRARRQSKQ
ncbi:MAG: BlaI/MecI/CopY family transcriptional regulator [Acidobacteria bacterium]|nr:BlaI/MecI/CopY family transcriptional regulator [Acidobacteriota bacterium]